MRVLLVNKFLYPNGGSETYIFQLAEMLKSMGHEVEFFGMEHENRTVGNRVGSYTSNMDFHTGKFQKLLYPFKIIYSREARKKIKNVLVDFKPDIVHLNNFNFQLTPSIIYEIKKHHIPIIFTAHDYQLVCPNHLMVNGKTGKVCEKCVGGNSFQCTKDKCIHGSSVKSLLGTIENKLYAALKTYRFIDVVISPSRFNQCQLDKNPALKGRTMVLRNFISVEKPSEIDKKPYVLYFGRYSEEKGVKTLIKVCKRLENIPFVFAGKGDYQEEIVKLPNVKEVGFQSGEALCKLIAEAQFTVHPSECHDNCPFSVMESQVLGTPVIGAEVGGIPELVEEGKTGYLFESGNVDALAKQIESLWQDRDACRRMAEHCDTVEYMSCYEYCVELLEIYKKAIERYGK
ncbi:MAG: glycosyltransferase [Lachnospiraceae bacterium]|nr:glycosyltransferase [Lachnospiraceae bacterium]